MIAVLAAMAGITFLVLLSTMQPSVLGGVVAISYDWDAFGPILVIGISGVVIMFAVASLLEKE